MRISRPRRKHNKRKFFCLFAVPSPWFPSPASVFGWRPMPAHIFDAAALPAHRAVDTSLYSNAWSSGRLKVNLCQQTLDSPLCVHLLSLTLYLMNLICTAHWGLQRLMVSCLPHTHGLTLCLLHPACCFMWWRLFSSCCRLSKAWSLRITSLDSNNSQGPLAAGRSQDGRGCAC